MNDVVAFVTSEDQPALTADDALAADAMRALGETDVVAIPWSAAETPWEQFDAVVIRSTWDYFRRAEAFMRWLDDLERNGTRLFNVPALARWNADKTYLRELAAAGVPIVPTLWFQKNSSTDIKAALREAGWSKAVLKPTVSASGFGTWVTSLKQLDRGDQTRFDELVRGRDAMVQPFMEEIAGRGEWSLVFFDGAFSHAILKKPAPGDFRIQEHFGGSWRGASPSPELIREAKGVLAAATQVTGEGKPLYARVDGVESEANGQFLLMELELVEPSLFFAADPDNAPLRFAQALSDRMRKTVPQNEAEQKTESTTQLSD